MEFETVLVIPNDITDNELYIAYTRALKRLTIQTSILYGLCLA